MLDTNILIGEHLRSFSSAYIGDKDLGFFITDQGG